MNCFWLSQATVNRSVRLIRSRCDSKLGCLRVMEKGTFLGAAVPGADAAGTGAGGTVQGGREAVKGAQGSHSSIR